MTLEVARIEECPGEDRTEGLEFLPALQSSLFQPLAKEGEELQFVGRALQFADRWSVRVATTRWRGLSFGEDSISMGWVVQHGPIASPSLGWLEVTPERAEIVGISERSGRSDRDADRQGKSDAIRRNGDVRRRLCVRRLVANRSRHRRDSHSYDTGDLLILFEKGDIARIAVPV